MDVPVAFDQNLDVEFHQTFEANEPLMAVHVRIWRGEVAPHEGVARDQELLCRIEEDDVIIAVSRRGDYEQVSGLCFQRFSEKLVRRLEI